MKMEFIVEGMGCAACAARVEKAVRECSGVRSVKVDLASKTMTAELESPADADVVIAAVDEAGYEASIR